jgi:NADH-quinone oxidoreductase subunit D
VPPRLSCTYYQWREKIYEIYEEICGARLTTNMGRIGGFERNFSELVMGAHRAPSSRNSPPC